MLAEKPETSLPHDFIVWQINEKSTAIAVDFVLYDVLVVLGNRTKVQQYF